MGKKTVTLPQAYWDRIIAIHEAMEEGTLSDALFSVVDLGFKALDQMEEAEEDEEEGEDEEEDEEEDEDEED